MFFHFNQIQNSSMFYKIFFDDMNMMVKQLDKKWNLRYENILEENDNNENYVLRLLYWRNMQL